MRRRCVAIGASNTDGWYFGNQGAYPAELQALLQAKDIDAQVTNVGVSFDTTAMTLRRIDKDVPNGTDIAIPAAPDNARRSRRRSLSQGSRPRDRPQSSRDSISSASLICPHWARI
jgi:hypothetical protein